MRDDFTEKVKNILGKRVNFFCSNPKCRKPTCGPQSEPTKIINIGVAAHITAASLGGPRFEPKLTVEERKSVENGIWLCQNCAKLVDNDQNVYSVSLLRKWKMSAEKIAKDQLESNSETDLNWKNSLSKQLTTFSRVEFSIPFIPAGKGDKELKEIITGTTKIIFQMISCAYLETCELIKRDKFVFALTLESEMKGDHFRCWGELITHLTPFAYRFGVFSELLNNGRIDDLVEMMESYPKINSRRKFIFGKFIPYNISRINPAKIFIEFIDAATYSFNGKLSTSDLVLYFSFGVNGKLLLFDEQNKKKQTKKNLRLINETIDGFDLSEIWINPDNPEKWAFN